MALSNSERQKRFRELTMKERQLKADAFDFLLAKFESDEAGTETIPLPDGRQLRIERRDGETVVQIVADPQMQYAIQGARLRKLYGE